MTDTSMSEEAPPTTVSPAFGFVTPEVLASVSGLDFLSGIVEGRFPQPPIFALFGFGFGALERGRVVFTGTPDQRHYNPLGSVHGGYAATVLDSCMGCAVHSTLEKGRGYTTLEFKVSFLRPMTDRTGPVTAEGRVLAAGRRTATAEGSLTDAKGRLLAHATTTCLVFDIGTSDSGG
ncbi:thioesterase [Azorhizobium oxalatiphilum]|uniref:Thioesterase n=1 Tax=Azorhizobium oxalatiphilum TaxID=980631 RepID=A0A917FC00_9HYPH|nr:PaaI family thioesterase [Azorhizobium oxalatiphilum]GGF64680.1 thioesterase [Azorhizobium oxalatiphilum]